MAQSPYPPPGAYPPASGPNAPPGTYGAYPQGPPPGPPPAKKGRGCLIFAAALAGGVLVLGVIIAVLALFGMRKYIANAKMAEARNGVAQIGRDAAEAYERGAESPSGKPGPALCGSASRSVPASIVAVKAKKYQSTAAEWEVDGPRGAGFACLKFAMDTPQYYMYDYKSHGASSPGDGFDATAQGDLDGDGVASLFKLTGSIGAGGAVSIAPQLVEQNPED
jgi:type IV pilus assembly protein PilA